MRAALCSSGIRFVDLGPTVFDCDTNLEWEKKLAANGSEGGNCTDARVNRDVRCVNNTYTWSTCGIVPPCPLDGTAKTEFLDTLNADKFAGHDNWRLPEVDKGADGIKLDGTDSDTAELETILLFPCPPTPCIDPIFGTTKASHYWSSVTDAAVIPVTHAWLVDFKTGNVSPGFKASGFRVRAVRDVQ